MSFKRINFVAVAWAALSCSLAFGDVPGGAVKRLVFSDDFGDRAQPTAPDFVGRGWRTNVHEPWSLAPGQTQITEGAVHVTPADGETAKVLVYR
ncbi:MAG: hypothetical protein AAF664_23080, partial [Planctomycetota bacterium]